jgi:hypothetical protein
MIHAHNGIVPFDRRFYSEFIAQLSERHYPHYPDPPWCRALYTPLLRSSLVIRHHHSTPAINSTTKTLLGASARRNPPDAPSNSEPAKSTRQLIAGSTATARSSPAPHLDCRGTARLSQLSFVSYAAETNIQEREMKLALILPAVIGMLYFEMSVLGQGPGFSDGRPLQISPTSPTPSPPTPTPSKPIPNKQVINWQHWQSVENFRYRIGSRLAGNRERYLELELTAPLVSLRVTGIHYGEASVNDVVLSPDNRSIRIKLVYGPAAKWGWNVTAYPVTQKQP